MTTVALIAHNNKKNELLNWVKENQESLRNYNLIGTTNTSKMINDLLDMNIEPFGHGPSGGDILL
ncbi:methylglyoxal synthase, partial [Pontibacter sp. HJ8]